VLVVPVVCAFLAGCGGGDDSSPLPTTGASAITTPVPVTEAATSAAPTTSASVTPGPVVDGAGTVETFTIDGSDHTDSAVSYPQSPPAGGDHSPGWQNCGVYREPVKNEQAVHSLEHGAVWLTYDPTLAADQIKVLEEWTDGHTHILVSPYADNPAPVVATAWGAQMRLATADDPKLAEFIEDYEQRADGPEPGAPCDGALGEPVKPAV
jgi:Protein of unknown function (DUF3105)